MQFICIVCWHCYTIVVAVFIVSHNIVRRRHRRRRHRQRPRLYCILFTDFICKMVEKKQRKRKQQGCVACCIGMGYNYLFAVAVCCLAVIVIVAGCCCTTSGIQLSKTAS